MKKILISLSIIGAVAAIGIGATIAYFNDTETSAGNILTAGTMDLKVDHKFASYDGNPCVENCEPGTTNLVSNGSFETPIVTHQDKWDIFPSVAGNWTVEWRSDIPVEWNGYQRPTVANLELHRGVNGWIVNEGAQYAELDTDWNGHTPNPNGEPASVKIYQDLVTEAGKNYQLKFIFSPRPGTPASDNKLEVIWNGVSLGVVGNIDGGSNTSWTEYTYDVTASGNTTRLEFIDQGTANSLGTFLDDVRLYPEVCTYQITGGTCTLWDLKDLGQGDYYWHYGPDMKPGDYGVNIISLHAYDNDAYACIITHNIQDFENTLVEPELALSDTASTGELSQFIKLFVWEDTNQNNSYDVGETVLLPVNSLLTAAMNPAIALTASNTKYIGLAWCFGTQSLDGNIITCSGTGNQDIAQTDTMTASITAYAEQQRNNSGFDCSKVVLPTQP